MSEDQSLTDKDKKMLSLFQQMQLVNTNLNPFRQKESLIGTFKREDIIKSMQSPELDSNQKTLRKISKFLYNSSPQFNVLVNYLSSILTFDQTIEPNSINFKKVNKKLYEDKYFEFISFVENMNLKNEFSRILDVVYKEGIYFGYAHHDKNSFFIQQLDSDYCKITYVSDGMYYFSFNLQYFYTYPERLVSFPKELRDAYESNKNNFKNKRTNLWYQLDYRNTICIKTDESNWYGMPPYANTFESAISISDFKQLDRDESEIGNYKILFQQIPIDTKDGSENKLLITADYAKVFHDNIQDNVPKQVGVITSPMKVEPIAFDKDTVDKNKVADSTRTYWGDTGVSQLLFSSDDKTTSASLAKAIQVDEARAFKLLKQFDRWLSIYLSNFFPDKWFKVGLPDISIFNRDDVLERAQNAATYGFPERSLINAALGRKPSSLYMDTFLENDILKLHEKLVPISSSHTQSANENGRPKNKKNQTDAAEKTQENDSNNPDVRDA